MDGFRKRHPELTIRAASCIKRSRAAVNRAEVRDYFTHLSKVLEGVPPSNIFNYDETNLNQNPGSRKAIFKRGVKYAEEVKDHKKTAISVMFCGSADGELLPPYVVYKAKNCWTEWCVDGPPGTVYTATASGMFFVSY